MGRIGKCIYSMLVCVYAIFSIHTFAWQGEGAKHSSKGDSDKYRMGKKIWQENNCQSCHQIFGLGGFLGPDLTGVSLMGLDHFHAIVVSGNSVMPGYAFNRHQIESLFEFLSLYGKTGAVSRKEYRVHYDGRIETNQK